VAEDEAEPPRYGIVKNLGDFNIIRAAFHEWIGIVQDVVRHPRHTLGYLFGPPGWSHDGSRETSHHLKAAWQVRQRQVSDATGSDNPSAPRVAASSR
jgi:hypothetical protein